MSTKFVMTMQDLYGSLTPLHCAPFASTLCNSFLSFSFSYPLYHDLCVRSSRTTEERRWLSICVHGWPQAIEHRDSQSDSVVSLL